MALQNMMGALSKATADNTLGVISLGSTLLKAIAVTTELNKTFISTGRQQMIAGDNLRKTFNHVRMVGCSKCWIAFKHSNVRMLSSSHV